MISQYFWPLNADLVACAKQAYSVCEQGVNALLSHLKPIHEEQPDPRVQGSESPSQLPSEMRSAQQRINLAGKLLEQSERAIKKGTDDPPLSQEWLSEEWGKQIANWHDEAPNDEIENIKEQGVKVFLDIDESAHGVYAAAKQTTHQIPASVEAGVGIGTSVVAGPLGMFALHGGIEEVKESISDRKTLGKIASKLENKLKNRESALKNIPLKNMPPRSENLRNALRQEILSTSDALDQVAFHKKQTDRKLGIGLFAMSSGFAILVKSTIDIFVHLTHLIRSAASVVAPAYAPLSIAGQMVLGPIAAISAVGLGHFFTIKAKKSAEYWQSAKRDVEDHFCHAKPARPESQYRHFIREKIKQRVDFTQHFFKRSWHFRAGSTAYAVGTIVPVVVALAGASLASFGIPLIVLGAGGAAYMAYHSLSFLRGHPKQGRYDSYAVCQPAYIDRNDLAQASEERRAGYYDMMNKTQEVHRNLLDRVVDYHSASGKNKKHLAPVYSETRTRADKLSLWGKVKCVGKAALDKMKGRVLNQRDVAQWLEHALKDADTFSELQKQLLQWNQQKIQVESAKLAALTEKLKALNDSGQADGEGSCAELVREKGKQLEAVGKRLQDLLLLQVDLQNLDVQNRDENKFYHCLNQIMQKHKGSASEEAADDPSSVNPSTLKDSIKKSFAAFLVRDFEAQRKVERGVLLEAEVQVGREQKND